MKIAHFSLFAPHRSGMYETTRDLVLAEREAGIEAELIDHVRCTEVLRDGTFATGTIKFADVADVYCLHAAIPQPYYGDRTPKVFVLHGHPLYTWQSELYGLEPGNPKPFSTTLMYVRDPRIDRLVTFWEDQAGYWQVLDGQRHVNRLRVVPRGLYWGSNLRADGERANLVGDPVLVIADQFRLLKDSFALCFAAAIFARKHPGARLHLFCIPPEGTAPGDGIRDVLMNSEIRSVLGSVNEVSETVEDVFRGADILLSSVRGESRVVLEALACGCDVVAQSGNVASEADFRDPEHIAETIEKVWLKRQAGGEAHRQALSAKVRKRYDIRKTVAGLKAVYEELL